MHWKEYCKPNRWHDAANLFPLLPPAELKALADDIEDHGLQHEIVLVDNKVLDGRNRLLACEKVGVEPRFVKWSENGMSPLDFVIAQNVKRRHLTTSQKAALAAKLVPQLEKDAEQRQTDAGKHGAKGGRGHKKQQPLAQDCAQGLGKSSAVAARMVGAVGERSVELAVSLEKLTPGTLDRMIRQKVTLQKAQREFRREHGAPDQKKWPGKGSLAARYIVPPFNVLEPKQRYWKEQQGRWLEVLDPVLCETIYRWHLRQDRGHILDLFPVDSTAGIVAARLGYQYTGIESRPESVKTYKRQAELVQAMNPGMKLPKWIYGDPALLDKSLPAGEQYDLIFTTLPQPKLGRGKKNDWGFETYDKMIERYSVILRDSICRLKQNRFFILKGRFTYNDEKGFPQPFFTDACACLRNGVGLIYYNQVEVMVMSGNCNDTLMCYWKGDNPRLIPQELGELTEVAKWPKHPG